VCSRNRGDLFTCARSLDELMVEVKDAAACHFHDQLQMGQTTSNPTDTDRAESPMHPVAADRR